MSISETAKRTSRRTRRSGCRLVFRIHIFSPRSRTPRKCDVGIGGVAPVWARSGRLGLGRLGLGQRDGAAGADRQAAAQRRFGKAAQERVRVAGPAERGHLAVADLAARRRLPARRSTGDGPVVGAKAPRKKTAGPQQRPVPPWPERQTSVRTG